MFRVMLDPSGLLLEDINDVPVLHFQLDWCIRFTDRLTVKSESHGSSLDTGPVTVGIHKLT